jgi:hypothetical protein
MSTLRHRLHSAGSATFRTMFSSPPGAAYLASRFSAIGGGASAVRWSRPGAAYMTLSGSDVTQWNDLAGNGNHGTDGTDRPAFVDPGGGADPYIVFTGANNDHIDVPYAQGNSATKYSVLVSFRATTTGGAQCLWHLWNGLRINYSNGTLYVYYASTYVGTVTGIAVNSDHAVLVVYDGTKSVATERVRLIINGTEYFFDTPPEWPSSLPASHTGGRLGNRLTNDMDFTGRMHCNVEWYAEALDDDGIADLFALLRDVLAYAADWAPLGTTKVEHVNSAPVLGAELALTATGYDVTPGSPVTIYDKAANHVGFPALQDLGGGDVRCYWRNGSVHVDPTGKLQYADSDDSGATWGAPSEFLDTAGVDDRDPTYGTLATVPSVLSVQYAGSTNHQLFSAPVAGGAATNVFGYPLVVGAQKLISRGYSVDDGDLIVAYSANGYLACCVGGTDVWLTPPLDAGGGGHYLIFEPSTVRLASGDLLCVTRTGYPATQTGPCLQLRSSDGETWNNAQLFPATHGGEPLGLDGPRLFQLSTDMLVVLGRRRNATDVPLTLLWSVDDGATWSAPVDLLTTGDTDSGYPDVIELTSTTLLVAYYEPAASVNRYIKCVVVTIAAS